MIVFGTQRYFRSKKVTQFGFCPSCDRLGKIRSYNAMLFFHLYFVPVIPLGFRKRTHKECSSCKQGQIFETAQFGDIIAKLKEQSADATVALKSGETTFASDDPAMRSIDCVSFLYNVADWLYAAKDSEFCEGILSQLREPHCQFAHVMLRGALEGLQGKVDEALSSYAEASLLNAQSFRPHRLRAQLLGARKRYHESIEAYKAAIAAGPSEAEYDLRLEMADVFVTAKLHKEATANFEWLVAANPVLAQSKEFMKIVNKSKKKTSPV